MEIILSSIQIAIIIVLPLVYFFKQHKISTTAKVFQISILYILWFLTYAPIHEISHYLGSICTGTYISDYQLIPEFWKGDFNKAFVDSEFTNQSQAGFSLFAPYLKDLIFFLTGYSILVKTFSIKPFPGALLLIILILSPIFDVLNNYSAYVFFNYGDFNEIAYWFGNETAHVFGACLILIFSILSVTQIRKNLAQKVS